jgi:hypothetical protein
MSHELEPQVRPPHRWLRVLVIMTASIVVLYLLAALLIQVGADDY